MLRRSTKIQLIIFVVITLLGISYVSAKYVGLTKAIFGHECTVSADFPNSGGIFTNAEVTYRGVTVGRVGALKVIPNGTRVDLKLDSCSSPGIPKNVSAIVANRSVVGEQYVDLEPAPGTKENEGPYLAGGANIPMARNRIPTATEALLTDLDRLFRSVPLDDLRVTIDQLGQAFQNRGQDLARLLDAQNRFIAAAIRSDNLNATIDLINTSSSVLQTQLDQQQPLQIWTHNLNLLSQQLKTSNPDFQHLLNTGPNDLSTIDAFIRNNKTDLGVTLANLATVGDILVRHLPGIEEIFELYPATAAGGPTTLHDRTGWLGLVLQAVPDPQDCGLDPLGKTREGYGSTRVRSPFETSPQAPNVTVRCTASATGKGGKDVRGAAHVPGGDPISLTGGGYAYPRTVTQNTLRVGPPLPTNSTLGDASWLGLVTDALH
ncbi:MAG TPA: MCE family protein [Jatrophihabitans sp.]|jgi:phospholipid/cholesterol/gamma-HCH transport system substrate-binding protein|nr:MCE family protein [Jatrophihabitans sp.]